MSRRSPACGAIGTRAIELKIPTRSADDDNWLSCAKSRLESPGGQCVLWSSYVAVAFSVAAAGGITLPVSSTNAAISPLSPVAPAVGERAPDFDYQSYDYRWVRFHHMLQSDAVVLVFAPDEATLSGLEKEREPLAERGVAPVAILGARDGEVWRVATRLGLGFSLLSDPNGVIARSFGAWDTPSGRPLPSWCVVGVDGRIRASGKGSPRAQELAATALQALGLTIRQPEPPSAAN
jgi:peroxiredoxin